MRYLSLRTAQRLEWWHARLDRILGEKMAIKVRQVAGNCWYFFFLTIAIDYFF